MQVFKASIDALQRIAGINVVAHSEPVWTTPVTGSLENISTQSIETESQQPYLNAVIRIVTHLHPSDLHLQTAAIEHQFGRIRTGRWQTRTIDLDLLLLGDHIVDTRSLTLPHPRMSFRRLAQTIALDNLVSLLSKKNCQWEFRKLFSAEKLLQLDSNLTIVVTFDHEVSTAEDPSWRQLKEQALRFAGPTLHLKKPSNLETTLNELSAAIQTIG